MAKVMKKFESLKILHLPTSVGGNSYGLSRGERKLGLQSDVLVVRDSNNFFNYPADISINLSKNKLINGIRRLKTFLALRNKYNIFHFNFGTSLLDFGDKLGLERFLDLRFYPKNAQLFVTYNGCDARQKYKTMERTLIAACHQENCYKGMCNSGEMDKRRREGIEIFSEYARHFFTVNPDLFYFLPQDKTTFLPYTIAYWDNVVASNLGHMVSSKKIRIVHAPTDRAVKGSGFIIEAMKKLQILYKNVEFILVEGKSNQEALAIYATADLVIDQILGGWYGGLAVEVMKLGKPVMVFIREEDLKFIPKEMAKDCMETFINVTPATIFEKLNYIVDNPQQLALYSQKSLEYVHRWHDPAKVALITKEIYSS